MLVHLLYLDTSASPSRVLLFREGGEVLQRLHAEQKDHGALIHTHITELLSEAELGFKDLSAVCVLNGPGSYTGLRISLSVAKGLCFALNLPLILLNKLEVLFYHSDPQQRAEQNAVLLHARTGECFSAIYAQDGGELQAPGLSTTAEMQTLHPANPLRIISMHNAKPEGLLVDDVLDWDAGILEDICRRAWDARAFADVFLSEPYYLKNVHVNKINKL